MKCDHRFQVSWKISSEQVKFFFLSSETFLRRLDTASCRFRWARLSLNVISERNKKPDEWNRQIFPGRCSPSATPRRQLRLIHEALIAPCFTLEVQKISRRMRNSCCIFLWVATSESEPSRPTPDINCILFHLESNATMRKYFLMQSVCAKFQYKSRSFVRLPSIIISIQTYGRSRRRLHWGEGGFLRVGVFFRFLEPCLWARDAGESLFSSTTGNRSALSGHLRAPAYYTGKKKLVIIYIYPSAQFLCFITTLEINFMCKL